MTNNNSADYKYNILFVEDDFISQDLVRRFLSEFCDIDITKEPNTAMNLVNEKKYDLILMDINLGGNKNGIDLANEIKTLPQYSDVPIVAVTAYAMKGDKEEFLKKGCTHYISKPFEKNQLIGLIKEIMNPGSE